MLFSVTRFISGGQFYDIDAIAQLIEGVPELGQRFCATPIAANNLPSEWDAPAGTVLARWPWHWP